MTLPCAPRPCRMSWAHSATESLRPLRYTPAKAGKKIMPQSDHVTAPLSPEQRARVDQLLDDMFDLPEAERLANLRARRIEDSAVLAEVESLLRAASAAGGFLATPPKPPAEELPAEGLGVRLGAGRIIHLIGRGGMGEVYEASRADGNFEQRVAIKLLQR